MHRYKNLKIKKILMEEQQVEKTIANLVDEIIKTLGDDLNLYFIGIHTGGVHLAKRIKDKISESTKKDFLLGMLDITLYRDDLFMGLPQPVVHRSELPEETTDRKIILVDDVLYTGRTVRCALDEIVDFGRPSFIKLLVLVDRGLREYPIMADFVGMTIKTNPSELVRVELKEMGFNEDRIVLYERDGNHR